MSITLNQQISAASDVEFLFEHRTGRPGTTLHLVGSRRSTSTLAALKKNVTARVVRVSGSGPVSIRLMEMGIVPGAAISIVRTAPLGDPIQVRVRGYHLALRNVEAETITVMFDTD
jgi:ferrous iron transport protein A